MKTLSQQINTLHFDNKMKICKLKIFTLTHNLIIRDKMIILNRPWRLSLWPVFSIYHKFNFTGARAPSSEGFWHKSDSSIFIAINQLLKQIKIDKIFVCKAGPTSSSSFSDLSLKDFEEPSNTGRTFVLKLFSFTTGKWGK